MSNAELFSNNPGMKVHPDKQGNNLIGYILIQVVHFKPIYYDVVVSKPLFNQSQVSAGLP
jgi:hypothetical protein